MVVGVVGFDLISVGTKRKLTCVWESSAEGIEGN